MQAKKWYLSKTMWTNLIAAGAIFASDSFGFALTSEETGAVLVLVNLVLRTITKQPLEL